MKIAIDLDMVLVDHVPYWKNVCNEHGFAYSPPATWDFNNYHPMVRDKIIEDYTNKDCKVITTQFPIYPGVIGTIETLHNQGHVLFIVTSRKDNIINLMYIVENFPCINTVYLLGIGAHKENFINNLQFDLWVDDYPVGYGLITDCRVLLVSNNSTPYNYHMRKDITHIKSFNEVSLVHVLRACSN